jgi:abortive infection bacteriophage resistance protein
LGRGSGQGKPDYLDLRDKLSYPHINTASPSVALAQGEAFVLSGYVPDSYNHPHKTYAEQVALLKERGYAISDDAKAADWLQRVGYYRLRPYWRALVDAEGNPFPQRPLSYAVDLYIFDQKLRRCLAEGLATFEIAARVDISHAVGRRHPLGHRDCNHLDPRKTFNHANWLTRADAQLNECREPWISEFEQEHHGDIPTWMAVEAWSFSIVSKLYCLMHRNDQASIAKRYTVNPVTFEAWLRSCATLRNSCAHHNRVWNKPLIDQPAVPKTWEARAVQHIAGTRLSQTRVYAVCAILAHVLDVTGGKTAWVERLKQVMATFPAHTGLSIRDAGFPANWLDEPLWQ